MKEWEKYKYTPDITFFQLKHLKRRRKVKYKGRRYIATKRKGKAQMIGNKILVMYNFIIAEVNTTYVVSSTEYNHQDIKYKYDLDFFMIGIDNHSSKCIEKDKNNFISRITPTHNTILRGAGGNLKVRGFGTVQWIITDDKGQEHDLIIKGYIYVPDMYSYLLSSQHWTQQAAYNFPMKRGTWCATYGDACVMQWNQRRFTKTIEYDNTIATRIIQRCILRQKWLTIALNCAYNI